MASEGINVRLAENIYKLRELKGFSREEMSDKLGMSLSGYGKIERGEVDVRVSRIEQIAQTLGVEVAELFQFEAGQVFNIINNKYVQATGGKSQNMHFTDGEMAQQFIDYLKSQVADLNTKLKSQS
ncbi:MAG: helix-turn-helix domain-containing protein [Flavobacteriales bacterium]|jgi:transcriptional regulator with XRE-family HTH domain|nr:helix-turn-helix domain-containing protein [Flavobacteriales bacterium]